MATEVDAILVDLQVGAETRHQLVEVDEVGVLFRIVGARHDPDKPGRSHDIGTGGPALAGVRTRLERDV